MAMRRLVTEIINSDVISWSDFAYLDVLIVSILTRVELKRITRKILLLN
jgi:hypothetical protein